jgi:hypothetical protein
LREPKVTQAEKSAQGKKIKGCSLAVRDLPLERFRLPTDGRKWRVVARQRRALLLELSAFANGDGTFVRDVPGSDDPVNYSPSEQRLLKHWAHGSLYRRQNDLRLLHLLEWERPNHYDRRVYTIFADAVYPYEEHIPDSQATTAQEHIPDSTEHVPDSQKHVHDSQEHIPQLRPPSVSYVPSLPSVPSPFYFHPNEVLELLAEFRNLLEDYRLENKKPPFDSLWPEFKSSAIARGIDWREAEKLWQQDIVADFRRREKEIPWTRELSEAYDKLHEWRAANMNWNNWENNYSPDIFDAFQRKCVELGLPH